MGVVLVLVIQAYRFALDPSPVQERALRSHAGAARFAWNWGLARCRERYNAERKWYSAADLHRLWNAQKRTDPALTWWGENSKCAYQEAFQTGLFATSCDRKEASGRAASSDSRG
jgi:putative transposase